MKIMHDMRSPAGQTSPRSVKNSERVALKFSEHQTVPILEYL